MKKSIFNFKKHGKAAAHIALVLSVFMLICSVSVFAEEEPYPSFIKPGGKAFGEFCSVAFKEPVCQSAYVVNLETGNVMYEKNPDMAVKPTACAKIMTAIVASECIPELDTVISASQESVKLTEREGGRRLNAVNPILSGEELTARQLLYGLLLTGANDAANVLAEYCAGSVDGFCELMNKKAKELGAKNTVFTNPTGIDKGEMTTTAHDMALISQYAYYINDIMKIVGETYFTIEPTNKTQARRRLENRNEMIKSSDNFYYGSLGLNYGSTPEGGNCLISIARRKGMTYLCVIMGAPDPTAESSIYKDAAALLDTCFNDFSVREVVSSGSMQCEIPVSLTSSVDYLTLNAGTEISALLPNNIDIEKDITLKRFVYEDAKAPVAEGQSFGELAATYRDIDLGRVPLVAGSSIERSNFLYILDLIGQFFTSRWFKAALISAIVLFIIYCRIYYKKIKRNRNYRK